MNLPDQPHIAAILNGLSAKYRSGEVVPRVLWFVGPDLQPKQTVADQLLVELGGDPDEWVIHMAEHAADVPIEEGARGLVLHFAPPPKSGPLFAPAFLDAVSKGDLGRALVIAMDYCARTGEATGLVDESIAQLAEVMAAGNANKRLIDAIRALWEIRHRLVTSPVPLRSALPALLAEVAAVLADLPTGAPSAPQRAQEVALAPAQLKGLLSNG